MSLRWRTDANGVIFEVNDKVPCSLPAGTFRVVWGFEGGACLIKQTVVGDTLLDIPNPSIERVMAGIKKFWESKEKYDKHGIVYKRGVLLHGPPGSGKTATIRRLCDLVINKGGLVILSDDPRSTSAGLRFIRSIEPNVPIVVVMEDLDLIIRSYGEKHLLALLDGEDQVGNVVFLATTNHVSKLEARILNRPSRFDERVQVDMPNREARYKYLRVTAAQGSGSDSTFAKWADDTEGMSLAHLREMIVAVLYLEQDYDDVLSRLRSMEVKPEEDNPWEDGNLRPKDVKRPSNGVLVRLEA